MSSLQESEQLVEMWKKVFSVPSFIQKIWILISSSKMPLHRGFSDAISSCKNNWKQVGEEIGICLLCWWTALRLEIQTHCFALSLSSCLGVVHEVEHLEESRAEKDFSVERCVSTLYKNMSSVIWNNCLARRGRLLWWKWRYNPYSSVCLLGSSRTTRQPSIFPVSWMVDYDVSNPLRRELSHPHSWPMLTELKFWIK